MENIENGHLKREIGVLGLSANIVNTVVGAGIFVLPALVAGVMGSSSIIAYLFCGFLMMLIMMCFAEIGSKVTIAGGAYTYIKVVLGRYPGFIAALFFLMSSFASDAAVANAIANITGSFVPFMQKGMSRYLLIMLILVGLGYINIRGVKKGVDFIKITTLAKLIPLVFILLIGTKSISVSNFIWSSFPSVSKIGNASLLLFFAFIGGETALSISGEIRHPNKTIPRAIFIGIAFILLLYIFIQLVSQAVLGPALSKYTENTLGQVANAIIGPIGLTLLTISAAISMFGNLSGEILNMPRVLYAASKDGLIPIKMLGKIHPKFASPYVAIIIYTLIDFVFALSGGFKEMAILASASILLIYLGVAVAVIKLRYTRPKQMDVDTYKTPGGLLVPIITILVIIWLLSNLHQNELVGSGLFFITITIIYLILKQKTRNHQKN